jgi:5'(3')-deoxyribonucleotidase
VFIDDLPEILFAESFPSHTRRILFDPEDHHANRDTNTCVRCRSWAAIQDALVL